MPTDSEPQDVIKIDTEGAESIILRSIPQALLSRVAWICGELHGEDDFGLLQYLSPWFDIGARKTLGKALFNFYARNRAHRPSTFS